MNSGGKEKRYKVTDCEFNQAHYSSIIGDTFYNPPGYAKVRIVWIDPMDWPEIKREA